MKILVCWIGNTDIYASTGKIDGEGPIATAILTRDFDLVQFLANNDKSVIETYSKWLASKSNIKQSIDYYSLKSPTDFEEIFPACRKTLDGLKKKYKDRQIELSFYLSPGTPHMASSWLILSETEYPARLIDSNYPSPGVKEVRLPVSLTAEWAPAYIKNRDAKLESAALELPPENISFDEIIHKSSVMKKVIYRASKFAPRSLPVLIEGESGSGKELFAIGIHASSMRIDQKFIPINCGAIPKDLVESELFGHEKGSFSGATAIKKGKFELAHKGTLFLDELGELSLDNQVKLLRVLEEKKIWRIGGVEAIPIDVRIIAATNKNLIQEVAKGNFREDLFYRLSVLTLKLPALRDRGEDLKLLIDQLLIKVNQESKDEPGYKDKKFSPKSRKVMLTHSWPGNVRELVNTIRRIAVWTDCEIISEEDVHDAIFERVKTGNSEDDILHRDLSEGIDLQSYLETLEKKVIEKVWIETGKRKKTTADLLGYKSYQNLDKRLKKFGIQ